MEYNIWANPPHSLTVEWLGGVFFTFVFEFNAAIHTLLFMKIDPFLDGIIMIGVISLILISLLLLIRDMDDPFEIGKKTYADADLSLIYKLKDRLNTL